MKRPPFSPAILRLVVVAGLLLLGSGMDPSQTLFRENRAGNRALENEQPEEALKHYSQAQAFAPDDPRILYNLGLALARAGKTQEAAQAWRRVSQLAEGSLLRDGWFNRGILAMKEQDPAKAARAFSEALVVDPTDLEAQHNLERALRSLQQQQNPQQSSSSQDSKKRDQDAQPQDQQPQNGEQGAPQSQQQTSQEDPQKPQEPQRSAEGSSQDEQDKAEQAESKTSPEQDPSKDAKEKGEDRRKDTTEPKEHENKQADQRPEATGENQDGQDVNRQMAERLLDQLQHNEKQALRRALRQAAGSQRERERPW